MWWYLVYIPLKRVVFTHADRQKCQEEYDKLGHDDDEDYVVISDSSFCDVISKNTSWFE